MENRFATMTRTEPSVLSTNKVIRNTYMLLSLTLAFSALTAGLSMAMGAPRLGILITLVGYFGLLFACGFRLRDFVWRAVRDHQVP